MNGGFNTFTPEQMMEYQRAFQLFDEDRDGHLDSNELKLLLKSIGQNLTKEELQDVIKGVDENQNNLIEFKEFLELMSKLGRDLTIENELNEAFRIFDTDSHGKLTGADLKMMMTKHGDKISEQEADMILREAEIGLDQEIDYQELIKFALSK